MQQERDIFIEALQKPDAAARAAYLHEACGGDIDLRSRVERLLIEHERQDSFVLDTAAPGLGGGGGEGGGGGPLTLDPPVLFTPPGTMIGRYKLLEPIGEGGYGTVFMAEQTAPVHRKVALKIVKAGMDTRQVIARFEAERQALALMDHPSIAKVFDAGVTETGRPYFVMELVKGVPITKYCDEHRLTPRQRLELLVQVCHAVQHAHQKGIIHRDLKPSNVLVAQYDGRPVPKVIDFGVAKATGQQLTERTMFTGFGDVIGTLEYMSPEQAELNQLDIDTRSDIYSLGVLLYELLTGSTPLEHKRVREVALLEVLRVIREEEPPKPSTRLSTTEALPSVAAQRGLEPRHLAKQVHGELDWIVMKALEKDRSRRYETANGLARDIERYMSDEPVLACPPSGLYRFRKFARRHRTGLAAAGAALAVLVVLVVGLAISNRMIAAERNAKADALREREQALAEAEAQRHRAEQNFHRARAAVADILVPAATGEGQWSQLPPNLQKIFSDRTKSYYQSLVQDGAAPSVRYETAVGQRALGYLYAQQKDHAEAEKSYRASIAILNQLHHESPKNQEYRNQLAWSHKVLAGNLNATTRPAEALAALDRAAELYEGLVIENPRQKSYPPELRLCYRGLIDLKLDQQGTTRPAPDPSQRVLDGLAKLPADLGIFAAYRVEVATKLSKQNKHEQAERLLKDALAGYEKLAADGQDVTDGQANAISWLSRVLLKQGRFKEAEQCARDAIRLQPDKGTYHNLLGVSLSGQDRKDEAISAYRKAVALTPNNDVFHDNLGRLSGHLERFDEASREFRAAIRINPFRADSHNQLGHALMHQEKLDEATAAMRVALGLDSNVADHHTGLAIALTHKLSKAKGAQRIELADDLLEVAAEATQRYPDVAGHWISLAIAHNHRREYEQSIAGYERVAAMEGPEKIYPSHWFTLAMVYWKVGERDKARQWYATALGLMEKVTSEEKKKELVEYRDSAKQMLSSWSGAETIAPARLPTKRRDETVRHIEFLQHWVKAVPENHEAWRQLAAWQLWTQDVEGYRRTCRTMLKLFENDDRPEVAERMAKTCSLGAGAVDDASRLVKLGQRAVKGNEKHQSYYFFQIALGMAHFRAGNDAACLEWFGRANPDTKRGWSWDGLMLSMAAMAHQRMGHEGQARTSLMLAQGIAEKWVDPQQQPWQHDLNLLEGKIIVREAQRTLHGPASRPSAAKTGN